MLFFALLLHGATDPVDPPARPVLPRITDRCADGACDSARRYRLVAQDVAGEDAKDRELRGNWEACGTTGAPVCPSNGRQIVHASLD